MAVHHAQRNSPSPPSSRISSPSAAGATSPARTTGEDGPRLSALKPKGGHHGLRDEAAERIRRASDFAEKHHVPLNFSDAGHLLSATTRKGWGTLKKTVTEGDKTLVSLVAAVSRDLNNGKHGGGPRGEIQAIILYVVFIIVYIASTSDHLVPNDNYYFAASLRSQFIGVEMQEQFSPTFDKTFPDIATVEELYHWLQSGFFHSAFTPNTFDGPSRDTGMAPGYTLGPNKIVGAIRLSQARLGQGECTDLPPAFNKSHGFVCSKVGEPTDSFGGLYLSSSNSTYSFEYDGIKLYPEYERLPIGTVASWRTKDQSAYIGKRLDKTYEAPAWSVLLDPRAPEAVNREIITNLQQSGYIDFQTAAVFVDLTVYNPTLDFFCAIKMVAEIPPAGGVYTSSDFMVVRLYDQHSSDDGYYFALRTTVGCFYLYYLIQELMEMKRVGWRYMLSPSNWLVLLNCVLFITGQLYRNKMHSLAPSDVDVDTSDYVDYWPAAACARVVIQLASANCFNNFFQGVEHLSYVPQFALLSDTIKAAGPDLLGFAFVFLHIIYGFVQAHSMVFRDRIEGFRSVSMSAFTLLSSLLGDFDFYTLYEGDRDLGPFFFIFFVVLAVFVVLNMIIAIISDAYSVCSEEMKQKDTVNVVKEVNDYMIETIEALPCGIGPFFRQRRLQAIALAHEKAAQAKAIAKKRTSEFARQGSTFLKKGSSSIRGSQKIVPSKKRKGSKGTADTRLAIEAAKAESTEDAAARVIQRQARTKIGNETRETRPVKEPSKLMPQQPSSIELTPITSVPSSTLVEQQLARQQRQIEQQQKQIQVLLEQQGDFLRQLKGSMQPTSAAGHVVART